MSRKMFSKFTSILQSAVEALAPNLPQQQNFVGHWKAVTRYFIENKEHKVAIEQTQIPNHLEAMLRVLQEEEADLESGSTGPCMEYLLQHKILETLYTLARTDCPPGMKQQVLVFFTSLMSKIRQPLLPHVNCHKAVHRLVRVCGEVKAAPTENEEIQFLCTVCAKLKMDPYLVNFFIETPKRPDTEKNKPAQVFPIMNSLLNLVHSADARVAVKACEGLMLCVSLPEQSSATCIVQHTAFCSELTTQLCMLYENLPKAMDPADIECVDANWGLDGTSDTEDHLNFTGKRALLSFLSWFDYCDQLVTVAHPEVAAGLAAYMRTHFLEAVLEPAILQACEAGATTATAHLCRLLRIVSAPVLLSAFVHFILGDDRRPEPSICRETSHPLRYRLIERCDHLSEEMSITSMKLFENLLLKPDEHIIHNLVLRNLLGRSYFREGSCSGSATCSPKRNAAAPEDSTNKAPEQQDEESASQGLLHVRTVPGGGDSAKDEGKDDDDKRESVKDTSKALNSSVMLVAESGDTATLVETTDLTPPASPRGTPSVHTIVNSFLGLVPDEAKSSYQSADSEYDTYLRDARRQFQDVCAHCTDWGWPTEPASDAAYTTDHAFHEGALLSVLLDKMGRMLDQSYDVNLQVTCVVARLAMLPHPNLHEYLLNPKLPTRDGVRTLTIIIKKVAHDVQARMSQSPDFARHLASMRQQLMGMADNIRRAKGRDPNTCMDDSHFLEGVIVLEEFCKELAAIACVKYYATSTL